VTSHITVIEVVKTESDRLLTDKSATWLA